MTEKEFNEIVRSLKSEVGAWRNDLDGEGRRDSLFLSVKDFSKDSFSKTCEELKMTYQEKSDLCAWMGCPINNRFKTLTANFERQKTSPEIKRSRQIIKQYEELENNKKPNRKGDYKLHPDYVALKKKLAKISKKRKKLFYLDYGGFKVNQKELERRENEIKKREAEKERQLTEYKAILPSLRLQKSKKTA